jgi:hypothetical protein
MKLLKMGYKAQIWDHDFHLKRAAQYNGYNRSSIIRPAVVHAPIIKCVCVGDKVSTPKGIGKVRIIDDDDTICVDIDPTSDVLYEFSRKEVVLYQKRANRKKGNNK